MSKQEKNAKLLTERFGKPEVSGGANWSVPAWKVPGKSKEGFDLYITDDNEDASYYSLIDRDWNEVREESIKELITSHSLETILRYYEDNAFVNKKPVMKKQEIIKWLENFIIRWDKALEINNGKDYTTLDSLKTEYNKFLNENSLPSMSADDLIIWLKKEENKTMTKQEKITWLKSFIQSWEKAEDTVDKDERRESLQYMSHELYDWLEVQGYNPKIEIDGHDAQTYLEQIEAESEEPGKDAFNDAAMFVEHYKEFLLGKRVQYRSEKHGVGTDDVIKSVELSSNEVLITGDKIGGIFIYSKDYKPFVEGEIIEPTGDENLMLFLNDEVEKTPFNDAELFAKEFTDYLIGKKVKYTDGDLSKIKRIGYSEDFVYLTLTDKEEGVTSDTHDEGLTVDKLQSFINGEVIGNFSLILQDEPTEAKINQPDYKYYVFNTKTNKILTGWEFKEDGTDSMREINESGEVNYVLLNKRELKARGIDPDCNECWGGETNDYSIIEEAVQYGVIKGDYGQELASRFIQDYKSGKFTTVIKARLVYFLRDSSDRFINEVVNCQYENALRLSEIIARINNELLKIVKKEI